MVELRNRRWLVASQNLVHPKSNILIRVIGVLVRSEL